MPQITGDQNQNEILSDGVFKPSRAEIAREMESRLMLRRCNETRRVEPRAEARDEPVFSG